MFKINAKPKTNLGVLFWLAILVTLLIVMPFVTIWSVNTLFNTNIPTTFDTWLAVIILGMFFNNSTGVSKT